MFDKKPKNIIHLGKDYFRDGSGGRSILSYTSYRRNMRGKLKEKIFYSNQTDRMVLQYVANLGWTGKEGIEISFLN